MSFVYLMVGDDAFKVGKSNDPEERLKAVKDRLGAGARVHMAVRCRSERRAFDVEKSIHRILKPHRIVDEGLGCECYRHSGLEAAESILRAVEDEPSEPKKKRRGDITAFGETMSKAEWARDSRCKVTASGLHARLLRGWDPERAIQEPNMRTPYGAFGESKTLREWASDDRCVVSYGTLRARVNAYGWDVERALSERPKAETLDAFGETKSYSDWAADPRCQVSACALQRRIAGGMPPSEAITRPPHGAKVVTAFGETKTIPAWARDSRATVSAAVIRRRIKSGWPAQKAVSQPMPTPVVRMYTWLGETKTAKEWAADRRCEVSLVTLRKRLADGVGVGAALVKNKHRRPVCAFGESKSITDWSEDGRCVVSMSLLQYRLKQGWEPERAMTHPAYGAHLIAAFGEHRTASQWSKDSRCTVSAQLIRDRLARGWPAEDAIAKPGRKPKLIVIEAFGETKTLSEWARDARCTVQRLTIRDRLRRGWSGEDAVSTPVETTPGTLL